MSRSTKLRCLHCNFTCGRARALDQHVHDDHGFLNARAAYVDFNHDGIEPTCGCGCGGPLSWSSSKGFSKFVLGHNGNIDTCYGKERADQIRSARSNALTGSAGWARGLTKESSETIRERAVASSASIRKSFSSGRRAWNHGLKASNDARIARAAAAARAAYATGRRVAWHKGQSKETCDGLRRMSISISRRFEDRALRERLDNLKRLSPQEILRRLKDHAPSIELVSNIRQYTRDRHNNLVFRCKECGDTRERSLLSALSGRCFICNPSGSKDQLQISKFIRNLGVAHVISNRSEIAPYELDIWSSQAGVAIEYNGLYFHSENFKSRDYHSNKSSLAAGRGIKLIHIFEDEWRDKRDVVESMLSHKFGATARKIAARKCELRQVDPTARRSFFDRTHMDGDAPARIAWGLFYENSLVGCLSLRKPMNRRYDGAVELCRFSCEIGTHVVGGLSKLVKAAAGWARENEFREIMTYVDTRLGDGGGYVAAGFKVVGKTSNRFWWTDDVHRYDRFVFRANSKAGLTEQQVAKRAGVKKIWGCPNLILKLAL